jgi:uncharacterized membrane protein
MTFGARNNWLVLIAMSAAGVCIRLYFVARHKAHERGGRTSPVFAIIGTLTLAGVAFALAPASPSGSPRAQTGEVNEFENIQAIVAQRCAPCHSTRPTQPGFTGPPNGVLLDTPEHILTHATQMLQKVETRAMPVGNLTGMTEQERAEVLDWIKSGSAH